MSPDGGVPPAVEAVFDPCSVRIALIPVGPISTAEFARCAALIRSHERVPLRNVTPPGDYSRKTSAFKQLSWSDGVMHLRFVEVREEKPEADPWAAIQVRL